VWDVRALSPDAEIERTFRKQAGVCGEMGSPLYADLLARCADDYAADGLVARSVAGWRGHPVLDNLPLRLLGAAHFLALTGEAPALAACLPSTGGSYRAEPTWQALRELLAGQPERIRAHLGEQVQTNEVRRCCALLGGFLALVRRYPWPLRLLEIGASAGLNQCFEQYHYTLGEQHYGPADAPLRRDCERARGLGFRGKMAIHPKQVGVINDVFTPTASDVERATRLVAAYEAARAAGEGVTTMDGRMVELPIVDRARRILAHAMGRRTAG
jgi:hypothetical protein